MSMQCRLTLAFGSFYRVWWVWRGSRRYRILKENKHRKATIRTKHKKGEILHRVTCSASRICCTANAGGKESSHLVFFQTTCTSPHYVLRQLTLDMLRYEPIRETTFVSGLWPIVRAEPRMWRLITKALRSSISFGILPREFLGANENFSQDRANRWGWSWTTYGIKFNF